MPEYDRSWLSSSLGASVSAEDRSSSSAPGPTPCDNIPAPEQSHQPPPPAVNEAMAAQDPPSPGLPPDMPGGVAVEGIISHASDATSARILDSSLLAEANPNYWAGAGNVVGAVMVRDQYPQADYTTRRPSGHLPTSPPNDVYMSDSEMTDALSDIGGVSLDPYSHESVEFDQAFRHYIAAAITQNHMATISEDTEDDDDDEDNGGLIMDYETPIETRSVAGPAQDDDQDDTYKFYSDDTVPEEDESAPYNDVDEHTESLSEVDFDDFYRSFGPVYDTQFTEVGGIPAHDDHNYISEGEDPNGLDAADPHFPASAVHGTTHERNLNISQFILQWLAQSSAPAIPGLPHLTPSLANTPITNFLYRELPSKIVRPSRYPREFYDLQQIPWWDALRVNRSDARELRDLWYTSYHNLEYSNQRPGTKLPSGETYFREKSMHTKCKATIEHFQLRNLMSVPAYNTVHFAHESKVYSWMPAYDELTCLIDLSKPTVESGFQAPIKISTMKSAHDMTIAGGFAGEYALRAAGTHGPGVQGFVTKDFNGITNHVDVVPSRTSGTPLGIFASNDRHLRILDCETNTFVADHELSRAINCTSTSQDGRLRVVIGDSPDAWVVEADTGRPVRPLRGHRDFGFACTWSPDMRQIATSNQDKTVIIWDVRMWRILEQIESDVAGYRSLRYSPVGGGPRTLLLCEPADRISVVNAQTYQSRQVHDFFGEIGGADFAPDGSTIWVANTDEHFGGFMEYERRQWGQWCAPRGLPPEWVREGALDEDERCMLSERERQLRSWWNLSDEEHESLLF